jgi:hypothetical protein
MENDKFSGGSTSTAPRLVVSSCFSKVQQWRQKPVAVYFLSLSCFVKNPLWETQYVNTSLSLISTLFRAMRWQFGAVLPDDIRMNMCEPEQQFFRDVARQRPFNYV